MVLYSRLKKGIWELIGHTPIRSIPDFATIVYSGQAQSTADACPPARNAEGPELINAPRL